MITIGHLQAEAEETPTETASTGGGVQVRCVPCAAWSENNISWGLLIVGQDLDIHLRNIWFMYQEQEDPFSFFSIFSAPSLAKIYGHPTPGSSRRERQSAFTRSVRNWETFAESNIFGFVWADSRTAPYLLYANWFTSLYSTDTAASSFGLKEITVDEISVVVVSYQRALLCFFGYSVQIRVYQTARCFSHASLSFFRTFRVSRCIFHTLKYLSLSTKQQPPKMVTWSIMNIGPKISWHHWQRQRQARTGSGGQGRSLVDPWQKLPAAESEETISNHKQLRTASK